AVFRCLRSGDNGGFKKLILTASGGPFYNKTAEELKDKGVKETLAHPTWSMGAKITVDSATLMNKGFEVIEACHIFNTTPDKIEVVVHRQSIVHSMVELPDGAVIAQLSVPDMRECIQYALTYPEIKPSKLESLDFSKIGALTFDKYDGGTFPLLDFACRCFRRGGVIPSVLNGANEEAVSAFLKGGVKYPAIAETVMKITEDFENLQDPDAEEIIGAGLEARRRAAELLR
ncbi:MAG: 1-deoxy-D-xylulose-5-phosphate reductoisomerase, partial [Ruminococcaceae bacterium]|nr:1-deoxy-D-xylulose-5-phosphate reductoisomerase [Oscillospiraceae bacterium]